MQWNADWATSEHEAFPQPHWSDRMCPTKLQCQHCHSNARYDMWLHIDINSDSDYYHKHGAPETYEDEVCPCIVRRLREWTTIAATKRLHENDATQHDNVGTSVSSDNRRPTDASTDSNSQSQRLQQQTIDRTTEIENDEAHPTDVGGGPRQLQ